MSLQTSYHFFAPFYDTIIERASARARQRNLSALTGIAGQRVLLSGAGTGLDFPFLPPQHDYVALDFSAAMQARSRERRRDLRMQLVRGDSMSLPFEDQSFDCVVLHLITAVVSHPERCLAQAARVLKPGGRILLFDKFLRRGQLALLRRLLNPLSAQLATRLDVVFEDVLQTVPQLQLISDEPSLVNGWFRLIELKRM